MRKRVPLDVEVPTVGGGSIGIGLPLALALFRRWSGSNVGKARLHIGIGDLSQILAQRLDGADCGQTLFRIIAVLFEVLRHKSFQELPVVAFQGELSHQDLAQRFGFVEHPGMHRLDESIAADEVQLQGQDAEEQVAISGVLSHGRPHYGVGELVPVDFWLMLQEGNHEKHEKRLAHTAVSSSA